MSSHYTDAGIPDCPEVTSSSKKIINDVNGVESGSYSAIPVVCVCDDTGLKIHPFRCMTLGQTL
jgi:hypothetical protein